MPLLSRSCRALLRRNCGFSFSYATLENAHTLCAARSTACRSYYHAPGHRTYGFRSAVADGLQRSRPPLLSGCGNSSHSSGLRAMHLNASSKYRGLRQQVDITGKNVKKISEAVPIAEPRSYRGILWTLFGANVAVFVMWHNCDYEFMCRHFLVSFDSVFVRGDWHTLITSAFSHNQIFHILLNLFYVNLFGAKIGNIFGGRRLLLLYLFGAIGGSLGHIFHQKVIYAVRKDIPPQYFHSRDSVAALGASGAGSALVALYIILNPTTFFSFMGLISLPGAVMGCALVAIDVYLTMQENSFVASGGHLGGALVGVMAFLLLRK